MTDPDPTRCGAVTRGVTGLLHTCDLPPHPDERWHASSTGGVAWRDRDLCRSRYPRPHNADPQTRIVACTRLAGHTTDHEEVDTGATWPVQLSTPLYPPPAMDRPAPPLPPPDAPTTGAPYDVDFGLLTVDQQIRTKALGLAIDGMVAWPMFAVGGAAYVAVCAALKLITLPTRAERRQRRQAEADRIQAEIRADAERLGPPLLEDDRE